MSLGTVLAVAALTSQVLAETTHYPAPGEGTQEMVIYSTLDSRLALTLIEAFQASHRKLPCGMRIFWPTKSRHG